MRLQKFLAQAGVASRRRAEELIAEGSVRVNGVVVKELGSQVDAVADRVEVDGRRVKPEAFMYRLLLKPRSCLSTLTEAPKAQSFGGEDDDEDVADATDEGGKRPRLNAKTASGNAHGAAEGRGAAAERGRGAAAERGRGAAAERGKRGAVLQGSNDAKGKPPPRPHRPGAHRQSLARYAGTLEPGWQVVAPLDFPSEGVVLLTTDGDLAQQMSKSGGKVLMTYHVKYQGGVTPQNIDRLSRGWKLDNHTVKPVKITSIATTGKNVWLEIVVAEARPRALKISGDIIRHSVLKISRVKLGGISFEGLEMGGYRDLTRTEIASLRRTAGLG